MDLVFFGGILDLSRVNLDFFCGFAGILPPLSFFVPCGKSLIFFADILDLSRMDLDFFCSGLVSICRIDNEINKSVLTNLYDLKVQARGHKAKTSRCQSRHHPMKGSHVHRMQRRFLLMTGTGKV